MDKNSIYIFTSVSFIIFTTVNNGVYLHQINERYGDMGEMSAKNCHAEPIHEFVVCIYVLISDHFIIHIVFAVCCIFGTQLRINNAQLQFISNGSPEKFPRVMMWLFVFVACVAVITRSLCLYCCGCVYTKNVADSGAVVVIETVIVSCN